jgi:ribosomal protein S26
VPYCPKCSSEYVEGTIACDDCGALLVAERPPGESRVAPEGDLVEVWRAQGELNAQLVRSLLEGSAISSVLSGESLRLTHGFTVDGLALVRVLVRREDARRASEIIALSTGALQCPACGMAVPAEDGACWSCGSSVDD